MPGDYGLPRVRCAYPGYVARETATRLLLRAKLLRNEDWLTMLCDYGLPRVRCAYPGYAARDQNASVIAG